MPNKVKFTSPFGVAQYPHISQPDTQGKYADNKYKTKLVCPLGDPAAQAFIQLIESTAKELGKDGKRDYRPYVEDEEANTVTFTFKSQFQPFIFDGRNNPIPTSVRIGGGSEVRVFGSFIGYGEGAKAGISAQFNQVQVKALRNGGVSAFEAVDDGYVYDGDSGDDTPSQEPTEGAITPNASLDI